MKRLLLNRFVLPLTLVLSLTPALAAPPPLETADTGAPVNGVSNEVPSLSPEASRVPPGMTGNRFPWEVVGLVGLAGLAGLAGRRAIRP